MILAQKAFIGPAFEMAMRAALVSSTARPIRSDLFLACLDISQTPYLSQFPSPWQWDLARRVRSIKPHALIIANDLSRHNRREDGFLVGDLPMGDEDASEGRAASAAGGDAVGLLQTASAIANRYFLLDRERRAR